MSAILKFSNLTKQYGKKLVLHDVNLDLVKGEIFGIIGMSGSGKTTLLNTLIGFIEPEEGDIQFYSKKDKKYKSVFKYPLEVRQTFGFATQEPSFYPGLTIEENLDHFGTLYGLPKKIRDNNVKNLLKVIGLENEKDFLAQELSGGMGKRLGIACSMVHNPDVLILDEPTANLDPVLRDEMWNLVRSIHKMGTTIIVASHLLDELEPMCNRVGILHNHTLTEVGTPDQLKDKYTKNHEIILDVSGKHAQIEKAMKSRVKEFKKRGKNMVFYTDNPKKTLLTLLHVVDKLGERIIKLEMSKPSLKEIFESIYKK